jgi:hypothetical protein
VQTIPRKEKEESMKFCINQIVEVIDGIPNILSTDIKVIGDSSDLYSLARDYLDDFTELVFIQRDQYVGYKKGKRYEIVLMPRQNKLIVCHNPEFSIDSDPGDQSKLFPYLWETEINTTEQLHRFFESYLIARQ